VNRNERTDFFGARVAEALAITIGDRHESGKMDAQAVTSFATLAVAIVATSESWVSP